MPFANGVNEEVALAEARRSRTSDPVEVTSKSDSCPTCGAVLIPIIYGFPGGDMFEQAERGEIELGGCCVSDNDPQFHCQGQIPHYWLRGTQGRLVSPTP